MNTTLTNDPTCAILCQRVFVASMMGRHCERAIVGEVEQLPGVVAVVADAGAGTVMIESSRELEREEIVAAVVVAGYEVVR